MSRQLASRAALLMMLAPGGLDFVALTSDAATNSPTHQPTFAFTSDMVGALAIVLAQSTVTTPNITASAGGWTTTNPGAYDIDGSTSWGHVIFSKVLEAGDVSSGLVLGSVADTPFAGAAVCYIVRGPTVFSVKSNTNSVNGTSTLTLPAFTPAATSMGCVAFIVDFSGASYTLPGSPVAQVRLAPTALGSFVFGVFDFSAADYTARALDLTGFDTTYRQNGVLIELLP